ncbi:MAG: DUF2798 domain-containing protein [Spirochaetales bacterium]|nr:DUF2798 domain-containing protein [Spirochaetales bacterium]
MGENKFQKVMFTVFMCFFMVLGMSIYNIILQEGFKSTLFLHLAVSFLPVFAVALVLDLFIVGPLAKKFSFSLIPAGTEKHLMQRVLSICLPMVGMMVLCMSMFGMIKVFGFTGAALDHYPMAVVLNFVAALPLNLFIVSPLVRFFLFPLVFPPKAAAA